MSDYAIVSLQTPTYTKTGRKLVGRTRKGKKTREKVGKDMRGDEVKGGERKREKGSD